MTSTTKNRRANTKNNKEKSRESLANLQGKETPQTDLLIEMARTAREPFIILNEDLSVHYANSSFYSLFETDPAHILGHSFLELGNGQWDIPPLRTVLSQILVQNNAVLDYRLEHDFGAIGIKSLLLNVRCLIGHGIFPDKILISMEDMTEREQLQQELTHRQEFTEKLIDSLQEAVLVITPDMRVHSTNQRFYDLFQNGPDDTLGKNVFELGNGQWDIPQLRQMLRTILPGSDRHTFGDYEVEHDFAKLGWRIMSLSARQLDYMDLILLTIRDVTDIALSRNQLEHTEHRYRALFESIDEGFCIFEIIYDQNQKPIDYLFLETNPAFERHTGLIDASGKTARTLVPGLESYWVEIYARIVANGKPVRFQNYAEELCRWFDVYAFRFGPAENHQVAAVFSDISQRHLSEEALRNLTATLEQQVAERTALLEQEHIFINSIMDNQPDPVLVLDREGRVVQFNRACETATGYDFEELRGTIGWINLVPEQERIALDSLLSELESAVEPVRHENHWCHRNGTARLFSWTNTVLRDATGNVQYIIGSGVDITDQRKAEEEARQHMEEAARMQRLLTANELAAVLAHELNQPLGAISMYADATRRLVLRSSLERDKLTQNLEWISEQALRGGQIIRNLLSFVKKGHIESAVLNLNDIVKNVYELMRIKAESRNIKITLTLEEELPDVMGVGVHIEQVLLNLLRNAIDAIRDDGAKSGQITVATRCGEGTVCVTVSDSGAGISAEIASRLFEPLYSTKDYGLGVGLRISRNLIKAMGGRLWVESQQPGGILHFELPLAS